MQKIMVTSYITPEVKQRIPELLQYCMAPSVSKLIEALIDELILEIDNEKKGQMI